ncbi:hypothetical protein KEM48_009739 [Puccinia striiformis f. sp. tritici PST-130]|nr:hypothetical protein KEM48_009739 [Puccinia striiformis f. sp. tritici PST-130]
MPPIIVQEEDLTGVDFEELDPSTSTDLFSRATGGCNSYSLYPYIDQSKSYCLNVDQPPNSRRGGGGHQDAGIGAIIRPIHTRNEISSETSLVTHQDTGPEMIVHVVFNQPVRAEQSSSMSRRVTRRPRLARVWTNRSNAISFVSSTILSLIRTGNSMSSARPPWNIPRGSVASNPSLVSPSNSPKESDLFLGVLGDVKQLKRDPSSQLTVGAEIRQTLPRFNA